MGKIFLVFLAYMHSFINAWKLEVYGKVGFVIHSIFELLTDANSFNLVLVRGTNHKITIGYLVFLLGKHSKCIYHLLQISILPYMELISWLHLGYISY